MPLTNLDAARRLASTTAVLLPRDVEVVPTDFNRQVYCIFGLPIDAVSLKDTVSIIAEACRLPRQLFFSTPNLNFLVKSFSNALFRNSVITSELVVADGMPLVWIAKFLGIPITERVSGATIFEQMQTQNTIPMSVFFFGGPEGAAQRAAEQVKNKNGVMQCNGFMSPGFCDVAALSASSVIDTINKSDADFLVVALGAEKGQAWIMQNRKKLQARVISHLGAVINMVAGEIKRAPVFFQRYGMEWLWRIKEEPLLWQRYWQDGVYFLRFILKNLMSVKVLLAHQAARLEKEDCNLFSIEVDTYQKTHLSIVLHGHCLAQNINRFKQVLTTSTQRKCHVSIDLSQVASMDCAFIGTLILLYGHQMKNAQRFILRSVPGNIINLLNALNTTYLLEGIASV